LPNRLCRFIPAIHDLTAAKAFLTRRPHGFYSVIEEIIESFGERKRLK